VWPWMVGTTGLSRHECRPQCFSGPRVPAPSLSVSFSLALAVVSSAWVHPFSETPGSPGYGIGLMGHLPEA
jgi:hypothetical protein